MYLRDEQMGAEHRVRRRRRGAWWGAPRHQDHGVSAHALHQCTGRHGLAPVAIGRHWDHSEAPNSHVWRWGGLGGAMGGTPPCARGRAHDRARHHDGNEHNF